MNKDVLENKKIFSLPKLSFVSIVDFLIFLYVTSIYIFSFDVETNVISRSLAAALLGVLFIYAIYKRVIRISNMFVYFAIFMIICLISILWAADPSAAISKLVTLIQIFGLVFLLYNYLYQEDKVDYFIYVLCISGTIFAVYTVLYFGVEEYFTGLEAGLRMGTEITNVNTIGLATASAFIISLWNVIYNKKKIYAFLAIISAIVSLGSGSRKALVMLIMGIVSLLFLKSGNKKIFRNFFQIVVALVALWFVLQLPMFDTLNERMESFLNMFGNRENVDGSTDIRMRMISAGWESFLKKPFTGVGIGNTGAIALGIVGRETYLHNNYIELLASVGIFGTIIYYIMYISPLAFFIKSIFSKNKYIILAVTLLVIELVIHYGAVQYYEKTPYMYLLLFSLISNKERIKSENVKENC